jgi:hypothetical protein
MVHDNGLLKRGWFDHGIGIPQHEQQKVFERPYRVGDPLIHNTFDTVERHRTAAWRGAMMVREITLSAIRQLESEIEKCEAQAKRELEKRKTRAVGLLRADLLRECRWRLTFMKYMLRDAKDRSARRRKSESPSTNCGRSEGQRLVYYSRRTVTHDSQVAEEIAGELPSRKVPVLCR